MTWYTSATSTLPPTRLPAITGTRLVHSPDTCTGAPAAACSIMASGNDDFAADTTAKLTSTSRV
jgi:hypothetical protein